MVERRVQMSAATGEVAEHEIAGADSSHGHLLPAHLLVLMRVDLHDVLRDDLVGPGHYIGPPMRSSIRVIRRSWQDSIRLIRWKSGRTLNCRAWISSTSASMGCSRSSTATAKASIATKAMGTADDCSQGPQPSKHALLLQPGVGDLNLSVANLDPVTVSAHAAWSGQAASLGRVTAAGDLTQRLADDAARRLTALASSS